MEQLNLECWSKNNLYKLNKQRQLKKENSGILPPKYFNMHNMRVRYNEKENIMLKLE